MNGSQIRRNAERRAARCPHCEAPAPAAMKHYSRWRKRHILAEEPTCVRFKRTGLRLPLIERLPELMR